MEHLEEDNSIPYDSLPTMIKGRAPPPPDTRRLRPSARQ